VPPEMQTAIIHRLELPQGRFERRVRLPAGRYSAVQRSACDGCLVITLQKAGTIRG
jgi:HSP20 family protein